ncbi:hypothetical protein PRIPAC_96837 [Pristionchus pacificus]|uniref:Uncharacterized protein n=1 Tax=Pristionchus pacificus TaxID=54126 RepID=A0A2A6BDN3_PRIPA|nr:hypothetical protein PRIPAC_96837 [Pristionchus pacificus]|eukprot:PDM63983.1 hypothetical protein PRIPAC_49484 [Pristionchus pacificus]
MANERPTGKEEEEEEAAGQSVESGRSIESPVTPNRAATVPLQKIAAKPPGQTTSSHHPAVSPPTDEPPAMMVMNGNRLIAVHPYPQVRPLFAPGFGPVNFFQPLLAGQGHAVHIVRDRQMPILLPKGLIATAIPPPNTEIQATEDDLVQLPDGSFTFSDEFNQRLRDAGSRQVIVTAPHGAQMGYQQAPLMGAPSSIAIGSNGSNGGHPETAHNGGGPPPPDPVVTQPAAQPQGVSVGIDDANVTSQPVTGTQESNGATKKESNGTKKEKKEKMEGGALPTQTTGQDQSGSGETSAEAPVGEKQDNNGGAKTEKKKGEGSEGKDIAGSSRSNVRKPSEDQGKKKKEGGQNGVGTTSDISTQSSRKSKAGGSVDSRPSTAQTAADESDQILDALGADEGAQKQKRKWSRGAKNDKEAAVPKRVKIEDDAEENPINNVNDAETSMPINETGSGALLRLLVSIDEPLTAISHAAVVWMKNRLEMDIPLAERKHKETSETPKASSSAEGAESSRKRGKKPGSELQQLLSMDFGPRENSRRSREVLPVVIHTAETAKTRAQMLQETPGVRVPSSVSIVITPNTVTKTSIRDPIRE